MACSPILVVRYPGVAEVMKWMEYSRDFQNSPLYRGCPCCWGCRGYRRII